MFLIGNQMNTGKPSVIGQMFKKSGIHFQSSEKKGKSINDQ